MPYPWRHVIYPSVCACSYCSWRKRRDEKTCEILAGLAWVGGHAAPLPIVRLRKKHAIDVYLHAWRVEADIEKSSLLCFFFKAKGAS